MKYISKKSEIQGIIEQSLTTYHQDGLDRLVVDIYEQILSNKVKFPLLEYCGISIYQTLPANEHILFCDKIQELKTEGGNVLLGIILQRRLTAHFKESIDKATAYIADADIWYICDIIGERVFVYSFLNEPEKTIVEIERLSTHKTNWVIRSLGAGIHYAIKKGLGKEHVKSVFKLLLSMVNTKDKEIRQGVGWAAKTTAKFHPDIITSYQNEIKNPDQVAKWFAKKIEIGLNRNAYAKRN